MSQDRNTGVTTASTNEKAASDSPHTPGPWEFLPFDCRIVHQRCDHGAQEIAWSDADYRLMAAAPDLLAALKAIMALERIDYDRVRITLDYRSPIAKDARAAIAKAEAHK